MRADATVSRLPVDKAMIMNAVLAGHSPDLGDAIRAGQPIVLIRYRTDQSRRNLAATVCLGVQITRGGRRSGFLPAIRAIPVGPTRLLAGRGPLIRTARLLARRTVSGWPDDVQVVYKPGPARGDGAWSGR